MENKNTLSMTLKFNQRIVFDDRISNFNIIHYYFSFSANDFLKIKKFLDDKFNVLLKELKECVKEYGKNDQKVY